jgi:XTP/dITP diphosphohydrolase
LIDIVLATRNRDKIAEIKDKLENLQIRVSTFDDFRDLPHIKEDGRSLYKNASKKAKVVASFVNKISLADDSGLEVDYLGGKPGIFSARFAGEDATYEDNNEKLLNLLSGISREERKARFRCIMVLAFPKGRIYKFSGTLEGEITDSQRGKRGFGYDPIFYVPELQKTLAEISKEEKNRISHRGKALDKVCSFLKEYISKFDR